MFGVFAGNFGYETVFMADFIVRVVTLEQQDAMDLVKVVCEAIVHEVGVCCSEPI